MQEKNINTPNISIVDVTSKNHIITLMLSKIDFAAFLNLFNSLSINQKYRKFHNLKENKKKVVFYENRMHSGIYFHQKVYGAMM